jgi:hypothetical protein
MFCAHCGKPVPNGAQFCPSCGARVGSGASPPALPTRSSAAPFQFTLSAPPTRLATLNQLVMLHSNLRSAVAWGREGPGKMPATGMREWRVFRFEDSSGQFVGEATSEPTYPARYTLLDENRLPFFILDSVGAGGMMLGKNQDPFLVHDAGRAVLASLELRPASWGRERGVTTSSWGRQYGVSIGGRDVMLAASNPTNSLVQLIELGSGTVLASGVSKHGFSTATTQIDIPGRSTVDHRIALAAFLMLAYTMEGYR